MKKIGEMMKDVGFQKDSSIETQKAFIKFLLRVANKNPLPLDIENFENDVWSELRLSDQKAVDKAMEISEPLQLSFVFEDESKLRTG